MIIVNLLNIMNPVRSEIYLEAGPVPRTPMTLLVLVDIVHYSKWIDTVHYADPGHRMAAG